MKTAYGRKSYQQPPSGRVKKREGKSETSPYNPYKRKGKGKEARPGCYKQPLRPRARARQGVGSRYAEAGAAADELVAILGGRPEKDRGTWAFYCYHHDIEIILDKAYELASRKRLGEIMDTVTAFQHWLQESYGKEAM